MRPFLRRFPARQAPGGLPFALLCAVLAGVGSIEAATLIVTNTADSGAGSLRAALADASDGDTIQFDPALNGQTITLTTGQLNVDRNITISGPGANLLTIKRDEQAFGFRIFNIPGPTVVIEGLTITNGYEIAGGGILNGGTLTITDSVVTGNRCGNPTPGPSVTPTPAGFGGGVANFGTALTIRRSIISSNTATGMFGDGGGINGPVTIAESIINNNHADGDGGGISSFPNNQGTITITNSTIDGNTAASDGGGIHIFGGLSVQNSTIRNNQASNGGGIYNTGFGVPVISNSTINNNTAGSGGGIFSGGIITNSTISGNTADWGAGVLVWFDQMTITNSTFAGNSSSQHGSSIYNRNVTRIGNTILTTNPPFENIFSDAGSVDSLGYNVCSDNGGNFLNAPGDQINTNPMLGPLQNNGGPTFTHDLLSGSPALDAGDPNFTPPPLYDQRGFGYDRVVSGRIDIGSFERQVVQPTPTPSGTPTATPCTILYDQMSNAGMATVSQNFEAANDGYDSQLADDFVVPAGSVWTIERVNVNGVYFNGSGPAASVNVTFYFNSGTLPGATVPGGTYSNLPVAVTAGNFSIALPTSLVVSSGTYWVSVQANMDFIPGGEWGWVDRTVQSNSPAAWQNPGGGFGLGCLTWGARAATCGIDVTAPDQIFQIVGCQGKATPTPTPTATPTATATTTATATPTATATATPVGCTTVLYDQFDNGGEFVTDSQDFETFLDAFDNQAADDFVVPSTELWTVQQVVAGGLYFNGPGPGPAASFNVTFYSNAGGLPGAPVPLGTYTGLAYTNVGGVFSIPLPTPLVLSPGTYWVSIQARMDFDPFGEWGWMDRTVTSNLGAAWQNPGGGFGTPCTTWGRRGVTCGIDDAAPDQIFRIEGCITAGTPTPTPTPSPTPSPGISISGTVNYCLSPPGHVPNATLTLTGTSSGSTLSDGSGNYTFTGLASGGSYTVTPTKAALTPGSAGINGVDVLAVQRHFLNIALLPVGCRRDAADVNGDTAINAVDVLAIQRFFLGLSTGIANVGKYQFNPVNRTYLGLVNNQTAQNYDTLVFGDVASPFAE